LGSGSGCGRFWWECEPLLQRLNVDIHIDDVCGRGLWAVTSANTDTNIDFHIHVYVRVVAPISEINVKIDDIGITKSAFKETSPQATR
jgi:hypothetical protein